jgi:four helix bundle protein
VNVVINQGLQGPTETDEIQTSSGQLQNPNTPAQSFRDLQVWQKSMKLTAEVYRLTQRFPRDEMFGLTSQLRRSAVSIPSNIAEGHGRINPREFRHFLLIARGSNSELQTQLELSSDLGFADPEKLVVAQSLSRQIEKMLIGLVGNLRNNDG